MFPVGFSFWRRNFNVLTLAQRHWDEAGCEYQEQGDRAANNLDFRHRDNSIFHNRLVDRFECYSAAQRLLPGGASKMSRRFCLLFEKSSSARGHFRLNRLL